MESYSPGWKPQAERTSPDESGEGNALTREEGEKTYEEQGQHTMTIRRSIVCVVFALCFVVWIGWIDRVRVGSDAANEADTPTPTHLRSDTTMTISPLSPSLCVCCMFLTPVFRLEVFDNGTEIRL